jgi:hypothetical protein
MCFRMVSFSRRAILPAIVIAVLLASLPGAIQRLIQTGPYLFTDQFFQDMMARLSGPGRFRFILQPLMAILLGARDGRKDARAGSPPFLWRLIFHGDSQRGELVRGALSSVSNLVAVAILLDVISQYLIFREIHPGAALILGPVLIATPYSLSRALTNRIARRRIREGRASGNGVSPANQIVVNRHR